MAKSLLVRSDISADAAADEIVIVVPAGEVMILYQLHIDNEGVADTVQPAITFECPPGTTRYNLHAPVHLNFGEDGLRVLNDDPGDNVEINVGAAGTGFKTTTTVVYRTVTEVPGP